MYKSSWLAYVHNKLDNLGLSYIWNSQDVGNYEHFKCLVKICIQDQYRQQWQSIVDASSKCSFYRIIKDNMNIESYLTSLPQHLLYSMVKLRMSNHRLPIEHLRHSGVIREERRCSICKVLGDEVHFLFHCPMFNQQRVLYLGKKYANSRNVTNVELYTFFNDSNKEKMYNLAKFVKCILTQF